jgi:ubiquitin carboxyl-terminal hydrolase 7
MLGFTQGVPLHPRNQSKVYINFPWFDIWRMIAFDVNFPPSFHSKPKMKNAKFSSSSKADGVETILSCNSDCPEFSDFGSDSTKKRKRIDYLCAIHKKANLLTKLKTEHKQLPSLDLVQVPKGVKSNLATEIVWPVTSWSKQNQKKKIVSPIFMLGQTRWRVVLFPESEVLAGPHGRISATHRGFISYSLESVDAEGKLAESWSACVAFALGVANTKDSSIHTEFVSSYHRFCQEESFSMKSELCSYKDLTKNDVLKGDEFLILIKLKNCIDETGVLWHNLLNWDSFAGTGMVGLVNQGATDYLNSLLQSLHYTLRFRKAVFDIPTEKQDPSNSVAYALQRLFYGLQSSKLAVKTNELTQALGMIPTQAHQHDFRVLQDHLVNLTKGTNLFTGKMKSYVQCLKVTSEMSRLEEFYDLQLNVSNCKNIRESFVDYCSIEKLVGDNKYFAEGFGLQDAQKRVVFESFPPILHLQLKRFKYDLIARQFFKINDRFEFGSILELDEFLDARADRSFKHHYKLQR